MVWKKSREFKIEIETIVKTFPSEEKYKLTDQLIRSVRSINSNIAEGHGKFTYKDQLHFCIQARGSLSETYNHLIDSLDCGYISTDQLKNLKTEITGIERLLNGYITYLRSNL